MRALVLRGSELRVDEVAEPPLPPGHVLLETIACGICGTDLHCRHHGASFVAAAQRSGLRMFDFDPGADLVMGHELSGRVLACGEGVDDLPAGTVVAVHPLVRDAERAHALGFSNVWPGGYAERVVVHAGGVVPLPAGTDPEHAALTEPLAVGLHAVNQSRAVERGSAIVVGCGPVGIAVITALRIQGVPLVVAADLSAARRRVAEQLGAHLVVDPQERTAIAAWREAGGRGPAVLFEAVGVPGRLDALMREAPSRSQIVVVGVCMEPDRIEPSIGVMKQQTISFALGWTAEEFRDVARRHRPGRRRRRRARHRSGRAGGRGRGVRRARAARAPRQDPRPPGRRPASSARRAPGSGSAVDDGHAVAEAQQGGRAARRRRPCSPAAARPPAEPAPDRPDRHPRRAGSGERLGRRRGSSHVSVGGRRRQDVASPGGPRS